MYKVIIAGTRTFSDYSLLKDGCNHYLKNKSEITVVCGMAKGADLLGKRYAQENNFPCTEFPANWEKYGRGAGYIRNEEMAKNADALIAFWDGKSKGTGHMINLAEKYGLDSRIVYYKG